jgi:hypothetical protein
MIDEIHKPYILQLNESIRMINEVKLKIGSEEEREEKKKKVRENVSFIMKNMEVKIPILESRFNELMTCICRNRMRIGVMGIGVMENINGILEWWRFGVMIMNLNVHFPLFVTRYSLLNYSLLHISYASFHYLHHSITPVGQKILRINRRCYYEKSNCYDCTIILCIFPFQSMLN